MKGEGKMNGGTQPVAAPKMKHILPIGVYTRCLLIFLLSVVPSLAYGQIVYFGNFSLANPGDVSVIQGSSVTNTITATLTWRSAPTISFSASGVPSGVTPSLSSDSCKPTCSTTLTLTTSATTPAGTYTVTVTGTGRWVSKTTSFSLIVTAAQTQADITVDATTVTGTVNPLLFGHNVLAPGGGKAIWDIRSNDLHSDAAPFVEDLAPTILRFPGGSVSDEYFWEDAIGYKTTVTAAAGTSIISLEAIPDWGTVSSGLFIDGTWGQFGDDFTLAGISGAQLQGVSGVNTSHPSGVEVRPGPRQGQPEWFSNQWGIDEHMKLVDSLGAEAIITVNYGTGRDQTGALSDTASLSQKVMRAAAWVAYLNGSPDDTRSIGIDQERNDWKTVGYWAQKRADRGHSDPYGVTYWEIGNEVYGDWEAGFTTARPYAEDFTVFATTMKTIDPSIKVGAVGMSDPHGVGNADTVDEWNATMVSIAGEHIDSLIVHPYYPSAGQSEVSYKSDTWFAATMAAAQQAVSDLMEIRAVIAANSPRAEEIELVVTEYGILPFDSTDPHDFSRKDPRDFSNLADSLYNADLLMALLKNGQELNVTLATAWNLHSSTELAAIRYDWHTGDRLARPQYYAQQLIWNYLAPELHSTNVSTPTFSTAQVGNVDATFVPTLEAIASTDDTGRLTLLVINRAQYDAITASIRLLGYTPQPTATVRTLTGDSLAANNEDDPSAVVLTTESISSAATTFDYTFPAHALTMIEFQASPTAAPPDSGH